MEKDEILELLNNPEKIEKNDKTAKFYSDVVPHFTSYYFNTVEDSKKLEWVVSAAAYLFGKACERVILSKIRPEIKRLWILIQEVNISATFNLPRHIEDSLMIYLDACETACEEYINNNLNFDIKELFTNIQEIGEMIAKKYELYNITTCGLSNDIVMTSDEIHIFGTEAIKRHFESQGFEILHVYASQIELYHIDAKKDGKEYFINVGTAMMPETGNLPAWIANTLLRQAKSKGAIPCFVGVGLQSRNELYASMKLAVKEGEYQFKISPLYEIGEKGITKLEL